MSPTLKSLILTTALFGNASLCAAQVETQQAGQTTMQTPAAETVLRAQDRRLSVDTVRENVALARTAYADIHPGYTRFASEAELTAGWDQIVARAERENGLSLGDFYLELSELLALIRCDHTKAELSADMAAERNTDTLYLPLQWTVVEDRAVVLKAPDGSGLNAGDEILSIDGRSIPELQGALHKYVPVDGYNDHVRDSGLAASSEFMGGAVDHFGALLWDVPDVASLNVRSADGIERIVTLPRTTHSEWRDIAIEKGARNFKDAVSLERVGTRGAVLSVDTFVNYRQPVDLDSIYGPVFEALQKEGRDQLILDLRRNGGGSSDAAAALLSYFVSEPRVQATAEVFATLDHDPYLDYISTWNQDAVNPPRIAFKKLGPKQYRLRNMFSDADDPIKPAKFGFDGELIALTSRSNSSGSTNLLGQLKEVRDVTFIGEMTGGNPTGPTAGTIFFMTLPDSGIRLRIPVIRTVMNVTDMEDGYGLTPDIIASDTIASVREGRDPALEAALARIAG